MSLIEESIHELTFYLIGLLEISPHLVDDATLSLDGNQTVDLVLCTRSQPVVVSHSWLIELNLIESLNYENNHSSNKLNEEHIKLM